MVAKTTNLRPGSDIQDAIPRPVTPERHKFTVADFYRMVEAGILGEHTRVELIDGDVVEMSPIGPGHQFPLDMLTRLLVPAVPRDIIVRIQGPFRVNASTEFQPDLMLLKSGPFKSRHPEPREVLLVVEMSDTTLRHDRDVKIPLYGQLGIPEAWLVDVQAESVFRYTDPIQAGYRKVERFDRGSTLETVIAHDIRLRVEINDLFAG